MKNDKGIQAKKVHWSKKKVETDVKKLFEVLFKTGLMCVKGEYAKGLKELVSITSVFKWKKDANALAYRYILTALVNAAHDLVEENQYSLKSKWTDKEKIYDNPEYVTFLDGLSDLLDGDVEIVLNHHFFQHPEHLDLVQRFKTYFQKWCLLFGKTEQESHLIANRLPAFFVFALRNGWRKNAADYQLLFQKLQTPLDQATSRILQWEAYTAYLQKQVESKVFEEAFGLKDIFVPLRAYYQERDGDSLPKKLENPHLHRDFSKTKKAIWVETFLDEWLNIRKTKDEIMVLSGGPGSGKSSLAKMWSAKVAQHGYWKVLFIPLHLFDIRSNVTNAITNYLKAPDIPLTINPLNDFQAEDRLLLVFDGLDELVMQGKNSRQSAIDFVEEMRIQCSHFNNSKKSRLKILIAGRPIAIQNAQNKLKGTTKQIVHLLPYYLTESEQNQYQDKEKILVDDQRNHWWSNFQMWKGFSGRNIPQKLQNDNLDKLTKEPLLNYLVALSWTMNPDQFGEQTNINDIYHSLLEGVYKRDYEEGRTNKATGDLTCDDFIQILEEIAICAWHGGDVRVTSERKIEKHIGSRRELKVLLEEYKESVKGGVSRLLTAFYFKKYGRDEDSEHFDETFEFTHKSFGEFLTARAIVVLVETLVEARAENKASQNTRRSKGWTEQEALEEWLRITGATLLDDDLITFIQNEIKRYPKKVVKTWQTCLCELVVEICRNGIPFSGTRLNPMEENRQIQNARLALQVLLEACALRTEECSNIAWDEEGDIKAWNWLHGNYSSFSQFRINQTSLRFIGLQHANLRHANLKGANLQHANLRHAHLRHAHLQHAHLQHAHLQHAHLRHAHLRHAHLQHAHLKDADLKDADLKYANLHNAHLQYADLQYADLQYANLQHAHLQHAHLYNVNLSESDLLKANFKDASLVSVNFTKVKNLSYEQLLSCQSLYRCKGLNSDIRKKLEQEKPTLFEEPDNYFD